MGGVDIRGIQSLLGHISFENTLVVTEVMLCYLRGICILDVEP